MAAPTTGPTSRRGRRAGDAHRLLRLPLTDLPCHVLGTEPQLVADYVTTGRVKIVFWPVLNHGSPASTARWPPNAGQQDPALFWAAHGVLFEKRDELWSADRDYYVTLVESLGADSAAFEACYDGGEGWPGDGAERRTFTARHLRPADVRRGGPGVRRAAALRVFRWYRRRSIIAVRQPTCYDLSLFLSLFLIVLLAACSSAAPGDEATATIHRRHDRRRCSAGASQKRRRLVSRPWSTRSVVGRCLWYNDDGTFFHGAPDAPVTKSTTPTFSDRPAAPHVLGAARHREQPCVDGAGEDGFLADA